MRTSNSLSPAEVAKMMEKDKSWVTRAIGKGQISADRDEDGRFWIEPSELMRAFPGNAKLMQALVQSDPFAPSRTSAEDADKPLQSDAEADAAGGAGTDAHQWMIKLRQELADMVRQRDEARARAEREEAERNRERRQLEGTIDDLRTRLDNSEEERRKTAIQLTALLTDQREKAETAATAPVKRRRFFGLLA